MEIRGRPPDLGHERSEEGGGHEEEKDAENLHGRGEADGSGESSRSDFKLSAIKATLQLENKNYAIAKICSLAHRRL